MIKHLPPILLRENSRCYGILLFLFFSLFLTAGAFAQTVTTDKLDYQPGDIVKVTGTGWQPGETVQLHFDETPAVCANGHNRYAVADANGNIYNDQYLIEIRHLGVSFVLTATGQTSLLTAQTKFTDGGFQFAASGLPTGTSVTVNFTSGNSPGTATFTPPLTAGSTASNNTVITVNSFTPTFIVTPSISYSILNYSYRVGTNLSPTTQQTRNSFTAGPNNEASAILFTANYGALEVSKVEGSYGETVSLTATFYSNYQITPKTTLNNKPITFKIGNTIVGTVNTNANGIATLTGVNLENRNVGNYTITASFTGETNTYLPIEGTGELVITKANQTIAFAPLAGKTFGDAPFTVSASATSGDAVSFAIVSGPASINTTTNTITITGAGDVTVRASQAGNTNYNAAENVDRTFTVAKANQTIAFAPLAGKTFGDAPFTVSASATSGDAVSFAIVSGPASINTTTNTITITGAGDVTVRASQAGNTNYNAAENVDRTFTVAKANPVITWTPNPLAPITYGTDLTGKLNATASFGSAAVAGTFVYKKGTDVITSSTVLSAGNAQELSVVFTPTNGTNYNNASSRNSIDVTCVTVNASANSTPQAVKSTATTISIKVTNSVTGTIAVGVPVTLYLDQRTPMVCKSDAQGFAKFDVGVLQTDVYKIKAVTECGEDVAYLPIYDPNGGFVTGGGWINSPAGALKADVSKTGKANFGFVAKYKKGTTIPDGQTEFQFQAGNLNFNSNAYDDMRLVIATYKANYTGTGKINGDGNYGFMVSGIDGQINGGGGVDKFRIKIWDKDKNDLVVYDNNVPTSSTDVTTTDINAVPASALAGGSIVIHEAKTNGKSERVATEAEVFTGTEETKLTSYPNPFTNQATIEFALDTDEEYNLMVYSVRGSLVKALKSGKAQAKTPVKVQWGDATTPAGVYIIRLTTKSGVKTLRIVKD
ncbi:T9SS type A sorting domain-containing protein [Adhaeribacter rhizoryzae]|uniref:T9SS type A sorting domain-containing protein n=1 Tax=Adhaeribacter rhizoryzae TaxID=2607907 RepID=A0A5M6DRE2_9BACT|nr:T9SS type A sorting domain-containing protein [Adhaeribacter rhizoryzae]KAA5548760.1 T9SS type A sorting domain-containing protein [Adhaeribacter rhizoryzae]